MHRLLSLVLLLAGNAGAATFTVDTTSDLVSLTACTPAPADCSLRGAIVASNDLAGADSIAFAIPSSDPGCDAGSGICRIEVGSDLPFINNQSLSIDGYTQPGAQPNTIPAPGANNAQLKIEITRAGSFSSNRLFSIGGSSPQFELRGLAIFLPSNGIVSGGLRHVIRGNWFGVSASGALPDYSGPGSVFDLGGFNRSILIGGPDPEDRNVIAGSGRDLGSPPLPGGGQNTIRVNSVSGERGRILFQGNLFGIGPDGVTALPFRDPLIVNPGDDAFDMPTVEIRDNRFARAPRNFSCNCGGALRLSVGRVMSEVGVVQGNVFGLGVDDSVIGTERDHIEVFLGNSQRVPRFLIGGLGQGEGNVFAGASAPLPGQGSAVSLPNGEVSTFVEFVGNRMLGNAGIGLDFPDATQGGGVRLGRSPNDAGDADAGANGKHNFPQISAFALAGDQLELSYTVDSDPGNSAYPLRVDFYRALGDEGEVLLGSDSYPEGSAGQLRTTTLSLPTAIDYNAEDVVTAIATDANGRSSEFSFDTAEVEIDVSPISQPAGLPVTVSVSVTATSGPFFPNGTILVSLPTSPATTCRITLLPSATPGVSTGSCELIPLQVGTRTVTATLLPLESAFAGPDGNGPSDGQSLTVTTPGPEQVGFGSCLAIAVEGRDAIIALLRPSGGVASVSVDLSHEAGSATPDVDYTPPAAQTISWGPGDSAPRLLRVPIAQDAAGEAVETFVLRLSNPQNTAILPNAAVTVRILDGEVQGFTDSFELACP